MEKERKKLRDLEQKHYEVEQKLEDCSKEEEPGLLEQLQKYQESIETQRKVYDDLEFQQLEVGVVKMFETLKSFMFRLNVKW